LKCGGLIALLQIYAESPGVRILKIGQLLAKLWTKVCPVLFDSRSIALHLVTRFYT